MNESELNWHSVKETVFLCTPLRPVVGAQVQINWLYINYQLDALIIIYS